MSRIEIDLDNTRYGSIAIDGEDISSKVRSLTLQLAAGRTPTLVVSYNCHEGGAIKGEAVVKHFCPFGEDDE